MESAHIDFETASDLDLTEVGVYRYVEHPSTRILCMGWRLPSDRYGTPVWFPHYGGRLPEELMQWVREGRPLKAWNDAFERLVWEWIGVMRHGFVPARPEQWHNPQALAMQRNLPSSLDGSARALGLDEHKDVEGRRLMLRMTRGLDHTEANFNRLGAYCAQDVTTEMAADAKLGDAWQPKERAIYLLSERINDRGIMIDREFVGIAAKAVADYQSHMAGKMKREFGIEPTQVKRIQTFCAEQRIVLPDLRADTVEEVLAFPDVYPDSVVEILRMRQLAAGSAPKKFAAMLRAVGFDDYIRGMFSYYGAMQTGRWSGRIVQLQNLARPTMSYEEARGYMELLRRERDWRCLGDDPLRALLNCVRPSLIPGLQDVFTVADESAIEARTIAWLAGCERVLAVFRGGGDIYLHNASTIYHREIVKADKAERQIGKVATLALGFGGGKRAFVTMGRGYGVHVPEEEADEIKNAWREGHPEYVTLWAVLDSWALKAVGAPEHAYEYSERVRELDMIGHVEDNLRRLGVEFRMQGNTLWGRLPSGRAICYPNAKAEYKIANPILQILLEQGYGIEDAASRAYRWRVSYWSPAGDSMLRDGTYGGKLSENYTQAVARDVIAEAMLRAADLPIVLHAHDELAVEGNHVERLNAALTDPIDWAPGLPLAASVTLFDRYWKD